MGIKTQEKMNFIFKEKTFFLWWSLVFFLLFFFVKPITIHIWYLEGIPKPNIPAIALAMIICSFLFILLINFKLTINIDILFTVLLLMYIVCYQVVYFPIAVKYSNIITYLQTIGMTMVGYIGFFLCGIFFHEIFQNRIAIKIIILSWLLFSFFEIVSSLQNPYGFYIQLSSEAGFYLIMADSYAYLSVFALSSATTTLRKIIIVIIATLVLSTLLSRASVIGFLFAVAIFTFFSFKKFRLIMAAFILVAVTLVYMNSFWIANNVPMNPRLKQIMELKTETPGFIVRMELLKDGINKIKKNIFGDFMGEVRDAGGGTGSYIHNIVSYARQYGIFPFLVLCVLLAFFSFRFFYLLVMSKRPLTAFESFCLLFSMLNSFLMITSRGYTDPTLWMQMGILSTAYRQRRMCRTYWYNVRKTKSLHVPMLIKSI